MAERPEHSEPEIRVVDRRWWAREAADEAAGAPAEPGGLKPTYVEELEQQLAERAAEIQRMAVEQRRALEEFEQVRVRLRRDVAREVERGRRIVLAELLEVVDNLDRAVAAGRESAADEALLRGVELVRDQFLAKLQQFGVRPVPALGLPFDAMLHEAVTTARVPEASGEGIVVAVLKEGYAIGDEMLRAAAVVVGVWAEDDADGGRA